MNLTRLTQALTEFNALKKRLRESVKEFASAVETDSATERDYHAIQPLVSDINAWITNSVAMGATMYASADRRILQSRINEWVFLLQRHGHAVSNYTLEQPDTSAGEPLDVECPYPGLRAYSESYELIGRDEEIRDYCDHLTRSNFLSVTGGSGTGKSSIVISGVLPALKAHPFFGSEDWLVLPATVPGSDPLKSLGDMLLRVFEATENKAWTTALEAKLGEDSSALQQHLELRARATSLVVTIDQFEELFSVCKNQEERERFSSVLIALLESGNKVITTTRTDHLAAFEHHLPYLFRYMTLPNERRPGPLGFQQLKDVIEIPARSIGLRYVPPSLVDERLAIPTARLFGGLPLLQYALQRLWENRPKQDGVPLDFINEECFTALPEVETALGHAAKSLYGSLPDELSRRICKRALLELVVLADFDEPLRRRRSESELVRVLSSVFAPVTGTQDQIEYRIKDIIDRWVKASLWVRSGDHDSPQIEVAHEALLRYWPDFLDWLNSAKADLTHRRTVEREADDWITSGKCPDLLKLRGEALENAVRLSDEAWLGSESALYVDECENEAGRIRRIHERAQEAEKAEQALRTEKKNKLLFASGAVVVAALVVASGFAFYNYSRAKLNEVKGKLAELRPQMTAFESNDLSFSLGNRTSELDLEIVLPTQALPGLLGNRFDNSRIHSFGSDGSSLTVNIDANGDFASSTLSSLKFGSDNVRFQAVPEGDRTRYAGTGLIQLFSSGTGAEQQRTVVAIVSKKTDNSSIADRPESQLVAAVYRVIPEEEKEEDKVTSRFFEIRGTLSGEVTFNADGTRVLVTSRATSTDGPPVVYLDEYRFSDEGLWSSRDMDETMLADSGCEAAGLLSRVYSAALSGDSPCPAFVLNDARTFVCPEQGELAPLQERLALPEWIQQGDGGNFILYGEEKLVAWSCTNTPLAPPVLLATGSVESASLANGADPGEVPLMAVATVNNEIQCWYRHEHWRIYPCLPGTRASQVALSRDGTKLRLIPLYDEIRARAVMEIPFHVDVSETHTIVADLSKPRLVAVSEQSVATYSPGTALHQPVFEKEGARDEDKKDGEIEDEILDVFTSAGSISGSVFSIPEERTPRRLAVSPNAEWIAYSYYDRNEKRVQLQITTSMPGPLALTPVPVPDNLGREDKFEHLTLGVREHVPFRMFYSSGAQIFSWEFTGGEWQEMAALTTNSEQAVTCLAASPNGEFLAIGTYDGTASVIEVSDWNLQTLSTGSGETPGTYVHPCAASDSGFAVFGLPSGDLLWGDNRDMRIQRKTDRPGKSLPYGIRQISIGPKADHVAILGNWQNHGCGLENMPGQSIWLWSISKSSKQEAGLSKRCLPNTSIEAIGVPVVAGDGRSDVSVAYWSRDEVNKFTFETADNTKDVNTIADEILQDRYGIEITKWGPRLFEPE